METTFKNENFGRKTSSLALLLSGMVLVATSLVLYIRPPTHVAYFSDWHAAGLTKSQWNVLHIVSGLLFVIAMFFHVYFNWRPMFSYLKNKEMKVILFTGPFIVSLCLTVYVCVGSLLGLPPMDRIIQWTKSVKIGYVQKYGTPPYGYAEQASLKSIARYMGWDANKCLISLREKGFIVLSLNQSIESIGKENGVSTGTVLENMRY